METLTETNYAYDVRDFFGQLPTDQHIGRYKDGLLDLKEVNSLFILCNQFFYITEIADFSNIYVSANIRKVLGFEPGDFFDMNFVYNAIHPEDREFVYELSKKTICLSRRYSEILKNNPFAAVFSIDFRMRCKNGNYIRVNRQTCCYKMDRLGDMIYTLSMYTDITHIKHGNLITYAWKSDFPLDFSDEDLALQFQQRVLTPREVEIITCLSQGLSAGQISHKLFISGNTVIKHRKNILHKTKMKNTAELVKYALEMGII